MFHSLFKNFPFSLKVCHSNSNLSFSSNGDELPQEPNGNNKPYIDGDHIVNATRGQMISMKCIVNNVKNYKVSQYIFI